MARSSTSPLWGKTHTRLKNSKGTQKTRSSIAEGLLRRGPKRFSFSSASPKVNRTTSKPSSKQQLPSHYREHRRREGEDSDGELNLASKDIQGLSRIEVEDDESSDESSSDLDESGQSAKQDWLDGSTLIAQYQDVESETEEERAIALVEYLQVPLQEKFQDLKRDLCNDLLTTMNDIRQAHIKIGRGVDIDRGQGIVYFNDACDKRHVDASCAQAQLSDDLGNNQVEIKKLFAHLKQAYDNRKQLWVDLQTRIDEITALQATVLDQLDDNMDRTLATLEKKGKATLKDDTSKNKEKLLRGVLGKL